MGDRCSVSLWCRRSDAKIFEKELGLDVQDEDGEDGAVFVEMAADEVNYGGYSELEEIAKRNIPFHGESGSGCEYGSAVFASFGGQFEHITTLHDSSIPAVGWVDGAADPKDVARATRYEAMLRIAKEAIRNAHLDPYFRVFVCRSTTYEIQADCAEAAVDLALDAGNEFYAVGEETTRHTVEEIEQNDPGDRCANDCVLLDEHEGPCSRTAPLED